MRSARSGKSPTDGRNWLRATGWGTTTARRGTRPGGEQPTRGRHVQGEAKALVGAARARRRRLRTWAAPGTESCAARGPGLSMEHAVREAGAHPSPCATRALLPLLRALHGMCQHHPVVPASQDLQATVELYVSATWRAQRLAPGPRCQSWRRRSTARREPEPRARAHLCRACVKRAGAHPTAVPAHDGQRTACLRHVARGSRWGFMGVPCALALPVGH